MKRPGQGRAPWKGAAPESPGFGAALKARRREQGLALKDIAEKTRLTERAVARLEAERLDRLPPPVFVKGFIRAYGEAVGLETGPLLARYGDLLKKRELKRQKRLRRESAARGARQAFLVFLVVAALALLFFRLAGDPGPTALTARLGAGAEMAPAPEGNPENEPPAGPKRLRVEAVSGTWVKVIADGGQPEKHLLATGEGIHLTAERDFNLLIGDPKAVRIYLDGQIVPVSGRPRTAVNIRIP